VYAYVGNNPVNYVDPTGHTSIPVNYNLGIEWSTVAAGAGAGGWAGSMWWLCAANGFLPIGDIIYVGGLIVCAVLVADQTADINAILAESDETDQTDTNPEKVNQTTDSLPTTGEPNSVTQQVDENGNIIKERHYGPDGRAIDDTHYTDHGNSKTHPEVPHNHYWDWSDPLHPKLLDEPLN